LQGDLGVWSTTWSFTIDTVDPGQIDLITPANNSIINDATPYLEWLPDAGATGYQMHLDDDIDFSSTLFSISTGITSYTLSAPLTNGTYYWRVRGFDQVVNFGDWSEIWVINIDIIGPNSPVLVQPVNGTNTQDTTPTLQTDVTAEAVEWNYQIATSDTFGTLVENVTEASNSWTVVSPLSDEKYFWRVRAGDSLDNWGSWSIIWTFTIDTIDPVIIGPVDFNYNEGATGYNISWVITENNLYTYEVYLNDVDVDSGLLTLVGDTLSISVDGLSVGSYNYTVVVTDSAGNFAVDTVIVTVNIVISEFNPAVMILSPVILMGICIFFASKRRK
ncbi:MAG: hypothetical protein KAS47_04295, partial [Candidatus Heimdallarchaeota archaeon]|nr:hypothetical protein [Candidatus Heimdallarchaeota archaeon]